MSLLDFAQWDNGSEGEASSPTSEARGPDVSEEKASIPGGHLVPEDSLTQAPGVARDSAGWRKFKLVGTRTGSQPRCPAAGRPGCRTMHPLGEDAGA